MTASGSGLLTDLYELTMAAAYFEDGLTQNATFELFVRSLPPSRSYLIVAGLEQALEHLSNLRFTPDEIEYLRQQPPFKRVSRQFFDYLAELRFTGDAWAMAEGTAAFAMEPLLRVTAPMIEAQIVETALLSTINFQTLIASKAARVVTAARGRSVIEFGTRRAHGPQAGVLAARAAYIGGCDGTSNVEAGKRFGIPIFGTMAHSFVMAFDREADAFDAFLKVFPETATILLDTYDTISAVKSLRGKSVPAVRLDSGNIEHLSAEVRKCLDDVGMTTTRIFVSGDLDEQRVAELLDRGAPIDAFGVGTQLATSYDAPALGGVYKLVSVTSAAGLRNCMKSSEDKATFPCPKQAWRQTDTAGKYAGDLVAAESEPPPAGAWEPLLKPIMLQGKAQRLPILGEARALSAAELKRLPADLLGLDSRANYPVKFSQRLERERHKLDEHFRQRSADSG